SRSSKPVAGRAERAAVGSTPIHSRCTPAAPRRAFATRGGEAPPVRSVLVVVLIVLLAAAHAQEAAERPRQRLGLAPFLPFAAAALDVPLLPVGPHMADERLDLVLVTAHQRLADLLQRVDQRPEVPCDVR